MLSQRNPRLRRINVVSDSFASCVSDAAKEFSWAPEVSMPKMSSEPGMLLQKHKGRISFKQLQSFADTHSDGHLNKEMDVINSDVKFINLKSFSVSNLSDEELAIHFNPIKLHRVHSIFTFPDKMESILSKAMISAFQIHFLTPKIAHANFDLFSGGLESSPSDSTHLEILNFEGGDSSPGLKAWVSSPRM